MKKICIRINDQTPSKPRPVSTYRGGKMQIYMPRKYIEERKRIADLLRSQVPTSFTATERIALRIWFHRNNRKADIDNLVGFVMEVLQTAGLLVDDYQVSQVMAYRIEDNLCYTAIEIMPATEIPAEFSNGDAEPVKVDVPDQGLLPSPSEDEHESEFIDPDTGKEL